MNCSMTWSATFFHIILQSTLYECAVNWVCVLSVKWFMIFVCLEFLLYYNTMMHCQLKFIGHFSWSVEISRKRISWRRRCIMVFKFKRNGKQIKSFWPLFWPIKFTAEHGDWRFWRFSSKSHYFCLAKYAIFHPKYWLNNCFMDIIQCSNRLNSSFAFGSEFICLFPMKSKHLPAKREKSHFNSKRSIRFLLERFVQLKMWWKMSRSRADALCLLINEAPLNRSAALCLSFDQQQLQQNEIFWINSR